MFQMKNIYIWVWGVLEVLVERNGHNGRDMMVEKLLCRNGELWNVCS